MSRSDKVQRVFAGLAYHQQVTIMTRLGLIPTALSGHPVKDGCLFVRLLNDRGAWAEAAPLIDRARQGTPI